MKWRRSLVAEVMGVFKPYPELSFTVQEILRRTGYKNWGRVKTVLEVAVDAKILVFNSSDKSYRLSVKKKR